MTPPIFRSIPAWLVDAWDTGQRKSSWPSEELMRSLAAYERKHIEKSRPSRESWFLWNHYSLLSILGQRTLHEQFPSIDHEYGEFLAHIRLQHRAEWRNEQGAKKSRET